jgi:hypothetical protein
MASTGGERDRENSSMFFSFFYLFPTNSMGKGGSGEQNEPKRVEKTRLGHRCGTGLTTQILGMLFMICLFFSFN